MANKTVEAARLAAEQLRADFRALSDEDPRARQYRAAMRRRLAVQASTTGAGLGVGLGIAAVAGKSLLAGSIVGSGAGFAAGAGAILALSRLEPGEAREEGEKAGRKVRNLLWGWRCWLNGE